MRLAALLAVVAGCAKPAPASAPARPPAAAPPAIEQPAADAPAADAAPSDAVSPDAAVPHDWYCIDLGKREQVCEPSLADCRSTLDENPGYHGHTCKHAARVYCVYMDFDEGDVRHSCMRRRADCDALFQAMLDHPSDFFSPRECVEEVSR